MEIPRAGKGYILLDILLGLFLFSIGFAVVWALNTSAILKSAQMDSELRAINLASSTMEELYTLLAEDKTQLNNYTSHNTREWVESYNRLIKAEWKSMNLVLLTVEIQWLENGVEREYSLEGYYYAGPS